MIKAIFFDLDGVLTTDKSGSLTTAKHLAEHIDIDCQEFFALRKSKYCHLDNNGIMTTKQAAEAICKDLNVPFDYNLFLESFRQTPIDEKMIALAKELKNRYIIGIITDNSEERVDVIVEHFNWKPIFNPIINSAVVKTRKTGEKIFEIACNEVNLSPNECIFIDNTQSNIDVCNNFGIRGIFFDDELRDFDKLNAEIEAIINKNQKET